MSDSYQAVYDAVRSRFACDPQRAIEEALALQFGGASWAIEHVKELARCYFADASAPHVLMRPKLSIDGDKWCALYGENLQDGVAGFGDTPFAACAAFDAAWLTPIAAKERA